MSPNDQGALIARSKCYLQLGEPDKALADAETALAIDKNSIRAIYQKAEALYYLGKFEHSLMFFHRGLRLRPELNNFRLGEFCFWMLGKSDSKIDNISRRSKDARSHRSHDRRLPAESRPTCFSESAEARQDAATSAGSRITGTFENLRESSQQGSQRSPSVTKASRRAFHRQRILGKLAEAPGLETCRHEDRKRVHVR